MNMDCPECGSSLQNIFDRCWSDESVMERFLADPSGMLLEHKVMDVRGMEVEVVEYKENKIHLIFHGESPDKIHLVTQRHPRLSDVAT